MAHKKYQVFYMLLSMTSLFPLEHRSNYTLSPNPPNIIFYRSGNSPTTQPSFSLTVNDNFMPGFDHQISLHQCHGNKATHLTVIKNLPPQEAEQYFQALGTQELFNSFHLYATPNYIDYMRKQPGYENFVESLYAKIHSDHDFRKKTRNMVGFESRSEFHDLIQREVERIKIRRTNQKPYKILAVSFMRAL